jgi:hypothetical protein
MARLAPIRPDSRLRRRAGSRPPRSITLIVCEGETELDYFKALRSKLDLLPAEIVVADNTQGSAPISVVTCAERRAKEQGGYDHIFCVFDRDAHESFERARERIRKLASKKRGALPIKEVVSIPCFEIWVLLHFEQTERPFQDCSAVISYIRDRHMPEYAKASARNASSLVESLEAALISAAWLAQRARDNNRNPYTDVHRLVEHMKAVATSGE